MCRLEGLCTGCQGQWHTPKSTCILHGFGCLCLRRPAGGKELLPCSVAIHGSVQWEHAQKAGRAVLAACFEEGPPLGVTGGLVGGESLFLVLLASLDARCFGCACLLVAVAGTCALARVSAGLVRLCGMASVQTLELFTDGPYCAGREQMVRPCRRAATAGGGASATKSLMGWDGAQPQSMVSSACMVKHVSKQSI